jgi:hypothetical protein
MLVKLNYENLFCIKCILEDFGNMSGLVCNVEKTMLLPIGDIDQMDPKLVALDFLICAISLMHKSVPG